MKLDLLKKLIKEAVKEAVREELAIVLSEDVVPKKPQVQQVTKYENYKPVISKPVSTGDPIMDLLNETRAAMTSHNPAGYRPDLSHMVQAPGLGMESMMMEDHYTTPEPGLDISQFDFINKAASVYKASVQKDKERFGG
jgi:hypothetical protein